MVHVRGKWNLSVINYLLVRVKTMTTMFVYKTLVFFLHKLSKHDYVKLDVITCSFIRRIYSVS